MIGNQQLDLEKNAIVLFDGECMFCDSTVQYIIDHDPLGYYKFSPLQSSLGREILNSHNGIPENIDSIVLVEDSGAHYYSTAVLKIFSHLKLFGIFPSISLLLPKNIRDFFYKQFAKHSYRLFGKKDMCKLPTSEIRKRFILD